MLKDFPLKLLWYDLSDGCSCSEGLWFDHVDEVFSSNSLYLSVLLGNMELLAFDVFFLVLPPFSHLPTEMKNSLFILTFYDRN